MGIILLLYLGQYFCSSVFTVAHSVWLFLGHQAAVQIGQDFVSHEHDAGTVCGNCSWLWCCHGRNWDEPIFGSIWMQSVRCPWKWVLKPSWKGSDAKEIGDAVSLLAAKSNSGFPLTSHTSQYICSFTRPWPINNWNTSADLLSSATCYSSKPRISK